jgi:hypothetical protein
MEAQEKIDQQIAQYDDWRGDVLKQLRKTIHEADADMEEAWKWMTAVFMYKGKNVCAIAAFKSHVKINFFNGYKLTDTHKLINAGLDSKANRAVDFFEDDKIKTVELRDLIREAISLS